MTHDELRALCAQATAGPWSVLHHGRRTHANVIRAGGDAGLFIDVGSGLKAEYTDPDQCKADARFIAAAREAVPVLLDENARLRAALRSVCDAARDDMTASAAAYYQDTIDAHTNERKALTRLIIEIKTAEALLEAARAALGGEATDGR
jgi:hypothetical protein